MRIYSIFLILFLTVSCGKTTQSELTESEQGYQQIINALNVGDHGQALELIETKQAEGKTDVELEYWKAQTYSLRAGVDVYSLFPLMKMKLFDVAISEWGDVNEQTSRARSQLNTTFFGAQSEGNKKDLTKKLGELEKISPDLIEYELGNVDNYDYHADTQSWCFRSFTIKSKHFPDKSDDLTLEWSANGEVDCEVDFKEYLENSKSMIQQRVKFTAISLFKKKIKSIDSRNSNQQYLKAALSLYESVPVIREIPNFDDLKLEDIYNALDELKSVRRRSSLAQRLGRNSQQQMGMLAAFLIAGSIKKSINLDAVEEPFDMVCHTKPEVLVQNYPHFRNGLLYLLESIKGTVFEKKNLENIEKLKLQADQSPDELTSEQKERIINSVRTFIIDNC